ncbi:MAG: acetyl-CoA carboxylase carboxyltransferase subunit alpha [Clostridiales bacterium]|nr:acetyl-CoA carboxylase carboxyltransferase subunit alpha [Clostridiales bacterium]MCI6589137.1 acetyl-CoA carboxylase carboxyltransferase subunit alpha [Clostridiales bacterium]MDY3763374.1 acetyl-CoA carboxylase carboxyltransferase subunit alpha [Candidatus Ventricola sp.]MDY3832644.1 acetyl-CoA carboxylase carboxyltransferase subunit alpha [Candidatus Ventricola sp.]
MIKEMIRELEEIENAMRTAQGAELAQFAARREALLHQLSDLTPEQKVLMARYPKRPKIGQYLSALFTDFFVQRGDRQCREDRSILGGIALFHGRPVTVLGHLKGSNLEENLACNFGMPGPEGYRKALRLMKQAEKFGRPVITFIDTPGAYPGMEAEERGQGEAIARNLAEMSRLRVPVISIVTGEGSSGGALALGLADRILMLENAYYSVVTPEGCASILWKDPKKRDEACMALKLTAQDLLGFGVIDGIIPEAVGGAQRDTKTLFERIDRELLQALRALDGKDADTLVRERYAKYRRIGLA